MATENTENADLARLIVSLMTEFAGKAYDLAQRLIATGNADPSTLDWDKLLPTPREELERRVDEEMGQTPPA